MEKVNIIEIEKMLFGDYRVQVWDKNLNSLLDREYFCRGAESAMLTAKKVKEDLFNFPIYLRTNEQLELLID